MPLLNNITLLEERLHSVCHTPMLIIKPEYLRTRPEPIEFLPR